MSQRTRIRSAGAHDATRSWPDRIACTAAFTALGVAGGLATYPAWLWLTARVGTALGMTPQMAALPSLSARLLLVSLAIAPFVEELVFRGVFLEAFGRSRLGRSVGVLASSAAFAGAHAGRWAHLATFGVGLALGATRIGGAGLGYCVALHAGLNLGALTEVWRGATPLLAEAGVVAWILGGLLSRHWRGA